MVIEDLPSSTMGCCCNDDPLPGRLPVTTKRKRRSNSGNINNNALFPISTTGTPRATNSSLHISAHTCTSTLQVPLAFLALIILCSQPTLVACQSSSQSQLPPPLQTTEDVPYAETRETYVPFPEDGLTLDLLALEIAHHPSPLVMEVTTTVTYWQNPLWNLLKGIVHRFRNQNQIIYVKPHLWVGNGLEAPYHCRVSSVVENETTGAVTERAVNSGRCQQYCTNNGRYCHPDMPPPDASEIMEHNITSTGVTNNVTTTTQQQEQQQQPPSPYSLLQPKAVVGEILRRLCIDDLYHATDLKHWEYLDAFEALQCYNQTLLENNMGMGGMAGCSKLALAKVKHTEWRSVEECVLLSGGLDGDVMNVRLQEELDRQQGSYKLEQLPLLHIDGHLYQGSWTVQDMFDKICNAYDGVKPLACDFCRNDCADVRHCLWYLECNGQAFDVHSFLESFPEYANVPPAIPPQVDESPPDSIPEPPRPAPNADPFLPNNHQDTTIPPTPPPKEEEEDPESVHHNGFFVGGLLLGLVVGMIPAFYFVRAIEITRLKIQTAQAARAAAVRGPYADSSSEGGGGTRKGGKADGPMIGPVLPADNDMFGLSTSFSQIKPEELKGLEDVDLAPPKFAFAAALNDYAKSWKDFGTDLMESERDDDDDDEGGSSPVPLTSISTGSGGDAMIGGLSERSERSTHSTGFIGGLSERSTNRFLGGLSERSERTNNGMIGGLSERSGPGDWA